MRGIEITAGDLNRVYCNFLDYLHRRAGLEITVTAGRITGYAISPAVGRPGKSKDINKLRL